MSLTNEQIRNYQNIFDNAWWSDFNKGDRMRAGIVAVAEAAIRNVPRSAAAELLKQHAEDTGEGGNRTLPTRRPRQ